MPVTASLFMTCLVDLFYPEVGEAIVKVLRAQRVSLDCPEGQTCCGLPLLNNGYHSEAARVARRLLPLFEHAERIVVPSGSCAWMLRKEFPRLFPSDHESRAKAEAMSRKVFEFSEFLVEVLGSETVSASLHGKTITYHDSCHLLRGLGVSEQPRRLIRQIEGVRFVEMVGSDRCCGFGGSFSVQLPEISGAILREKMRNIEATQADIVVADDCGCIMQMKGGLARIPNGARVLHLAQVLAGEGI
ncbi:MAG: (Fe-S)-binding protein [Candidatus Methylomirabilis sp.]